MKIKSKASLIFVLSVLILSNIQFSTALIEDDPCCPFWSDSSCGFEHLPGEICCHDPIDEFTWKCVKSVCDFVADIPQALKEACNLIYLDCTENYKYDCFGTKG